MNTEIYHINNEGIISFHASYSQPPEMALKCAAIQLAKRWDTWNYHKIFVPIKEVNGRFIFNFGNNQAFFTRRTK
jgi:hypothetical protein